MEFIKSMAPVVVAGAVAIILVLTIKKKRKSVIGKKRRDGYVYCVQREDMADWPGWSS